MGRGLGHVQRIVLDRLGEVHVEGGPAGLRVCQLTRRVYGPAPTRVQYDVVRHAVDGLERRGLVETRRSWRTRRVRLTEPPRTPAPSEPLAAQGIQPSNSV
jgi:hypothetical protein